LDYLTTHTSLSPIRCGFAPGFVNYKKRVHSTRSSSDKVYQLLSHGRWFSPGTPVSSTTKTGCHDIAEILLKVKHQNSNSKFSCVMTSCILHFFLQIRYFFLKNDANYVYYYIKELNQVRVNFTQMTFSFQNL
jgi:hypothetical protein